MSLTSIILVDLLGLENLSSAFGIITSVRGVSSIVGPPMAGAIFDYSGSFRMVFITSALLFAAASIISFFASKYENKEEEE